MAKEGGSLQKISDEQIEGFLGLFRGDASAAHRALSQYQGKAKTRIQSASSERVVNVTDLKKSYQIGGQEIVALNGVNLEIFKGEFVALTGPSGSGKSTLLQLIGGLDKPTQGEIVVRGTSLAGLRDSDLSEFRNRTVGFVFQFFYLQPFLKLKQNLEVAGMPARTKPSLRAQRAIDLARLVGLTNRLDHYPRELSGGQMQRAAIARALLNNPEIILADEPTGNLDSANGLAVINLFQKIRKEFGTTIIIVTHDPVIAARADREIMLRDGEIE